MLYKKRMVQIKKVPKKIRTPFSIALHYAATRMRSLIFEFYNVSTQLLPTPYKQGLESH